LIFLPELDERADILMFIGRDVSDAHHVWEQVLWSPNAHFAQQDGLN